MVKFGQRLVRGIVYGNVVGFALGMLGYLVAAAVNALAGQQQLNTIAFLLFGYASGFGSSVAIEVSKEMEEKEA